MINIEDYDMMDLEEAIHKLETMKRREEILARHKERHKITRGPDKRYRTYVRVGGKNKLIAKSRLSDLEDYLVEFYEKEEPHQKKYEINFRKAFKEFRDYKSEMVSDNTIYKYDADYKRFFSGTKFETRCLITINELDCIQFITSRIRELKLGRRAYEALYSYVAGTFRYMWMNRVLDENPMERLQRKDYYRFCTKTRHDPKKRIVSSSEREAIDNQMRFDRINDPQLITPYAVELAELTGLRVGELAALTWDCVNFEDRVITIDKAEIYHYKNALHEIGATKTGEVRYVPMTDKIQQLLNTVRAVEEKYGFIGKYVFMGKNGRVSKNAIGHYIRSVCNRCGLPDTKSIHSFRRTLNSKLKLVGTDTETAASMLGHSTDVNNNCYSYDVTDMNYKREMLDKAQKSAV